MSRKPQKQRTLYVTKGREPSDFEAWKRAVWLNDVVAERLAELPRNEVDQALADYDQPGAYELWRRRRVEQVLNAELIEGRHAIYAALPGEPPHEINQIAPEFMVSVTLDSATNSAKGEGHELINIRLKLDARKKPSPKPRPVSARADGGRPNMKKRIQAEALGLSKTDDKFRKLKNRTDQAREVKARVLGEEVRNYDEMPGCKLESVKRWIGEVLD